VPQGTSQEQRRLQFLLQLLLLLLLLLRLEAFLLRLLLLRLEASCGHRMLQASPLADALACWTALAAA
jgi:hypothetical protein